MYNIIFVIVWQELDVTDSMSTAGDERDRYIDQVAMILLNVNLVFV